ncbi:melatonin receptor type 1A-like [Amphiura filiformis]|uniref:melatonin receptor type 1A-like n=1 Tax=Amphiura filiformis TaxID=82378 RepID=UPI003B21025D
MDVDVLIDTNHTENDTRIDYSTLYENETTGNYNSSSSVPFLPGRFIPYITWLILMALIGTAGNLLIIFSLVVSKKLRVISNIFVVNLAFADIFVTTIIDPFSVVAVFNEGEFFYSHPGLCIFAGAFVVTCCACSIWTIVAISVERYIHICHRAVYPKIFNRSTAPVILVFLWIIAFSIALPYFEVFGWGIYGYFPKGRICTCIFNVSYFYSWYLIGFELILPMIIIPFCYINIYLLVRKSGRRLTKHNVVTRNPHKWQDADMRILKMVITIWAVFMIMWAPYTTNVLFDTNASWPDLFFITAVAFCLSNSSINFIIYGIMNENFREAYVMVLVKILPAFKTTFVKDDEERENASVVDSKSLGASRAMQTSNSCLTDMTDTSKTGTNSPVWDISSKVC